MDARRFDAFTRVISARLSRRAALRQGGAGLLGTTAAVAGLRVPGAAQEATPGTPSASSGGARYLYVQTFGGGSLEPRPEDDGRFLLTLTDAPALTIAFADRPSRQTDSLPTGELPGELGFTDANPPNASLVTRTDNGEEFVVVVELFAPAYDPASRTLTYVVRELAEYSSFGSDLAGRTQPLANLPASFGLASLFIDSGGGGCIGFASACSGGDSCCSDLSCVAVTCTPDDPSQTSMPNLEFSMCMTSP